MHQHGAAALDDDNGSGGAGGNGGGGFLGLYILLRCYLFYAFAGD